MLRPARYAPLDTDTPDQVADIAYLCGRELDPDDERSAWIDGHPDRRALISAYHAGQAEQYECEDW